MEKALPSVKEGVLSEEETSFEEDLVEEAKTDNIRCLLLLKDFFFRNEKEILQILS